MRTFTSVKTETTREVLERMWAEATGDGDEMLDRIAEWVDAALDAAVTAGQQQQVTAYRCNVCQRLGTAEGVGFPCGYSCNGTIAAAEQYAAPPPAPEPHRVQGVVFILRDKQGRVLMERCPKKAARHAAEWFIPGGRVEAGETPLEALDREMYEELACRTLDPYPLPIIDACGGPGWPSFLMQPYLVSDWIGEVPTHTLDHPDVPLRWVPWAEACASPAPVIRAMLAAGGAV